MKKIDFEEYLQDIFMTSYGGIKETLDDAFEGWLQQLDVQELIDYGQRYAEFISYQK